MHVCLDRDRLLGSGADARHTRPSTRFPQAGSQQCKPCRLCRIGASCRGQFARPVPRVAPTDAAAPPRRGGGVVGGARADGRACRGCHGRDALDGRWHRLARRDGALITAAQPDGRGAVPNDCLRGADAAGDRSSPCGADGGRYHGCGPLCCLRCVCRDAWCGRVSGSRRCWRPVVWWVRR